MYLAHGVLGSMRRRSRSSAQCCASSSVRLWDSTTLGGRVLSCRRGGCSSKLLYRENASLNGRWTSWHSVQLRPVGLVPEKFVAGILEWLQLYPFLCPAGALCACSEARFRAAFPGSVEPGNLPAVFAKVKAREDSLLSQQSAMCPIGVGAAPFGWTETRRLTDEDALTAMAPLPGTDAAAAASSRKSGLISQQSAMCQVDAGAAPSGGPETKELTDKAAPGAPGARRGAGR